MERSVSGTAVLDKAVAILDVLSTGPLGLAQIAARTGIARPTAHRLCAALEHHRLVERDGDDKRRIGPRLAQWADMRTSLEDRLISASISALAALRDETGESVQIYVRDGDGRRVIAGLESPHGLRTIVDVGSVLPLDVGSAGEVLRSTDAVRRKGWAQSVEEREKGVASVSAPIIVDGEVVAAVSVSGPIDRTTRAPGRRYAVAVRKTAGAISSAMRESR